MHKLLNIAGYVYEELTDKFIDDKDLGREFWKYLKSKMLDDMTKKVKVSDFVYLQILELDSEQFDKKYDMKLSNVKKSKEQLEFVTQVVTQMLKCSDNQMIDW